MSTPRKELRDELLAVTAARQELSPDEESYLIENFLQRLDDEIDARVDARIDARLKSLPRRGPGMEGWVVPAALGVAVPISAIAAIFAGGPGLLIAWIGIIAVLAIYMESHKGG